MHIGSIENFGQDQVNMEQFDMAHLGQSGDQFHYEAPNLMPNNPSQVQMPIESPSFVPLVQPPLPQYQQFTQLQQQLQPFQPSQLQQQQPQVIASFKID